MSNAPIGVTFDVPAIPPIEEQTTYFDAGAIRFGLENRELTPDVVGAHLGGIDREPTPEELAQFDDGGMSIHVFDAETGFEHLRFDMFHKEPHYHYLYPEHLLVIGFDSHANGDMWTWVLNSLRTRLREMLRFAEATGLAGRVDDASVEQALAEVERARARVMA
jgi:hypothetical protein